MQAGDDSNLMHFSFQNKTIPFTNHSQSLFNGSSGSFCDCPSVDLLFRGGLTCLSLMFHNKQIMSRAILLAGVLRAQPRTTGRD